MERKIKEGCSMQDRCVDTCMHEHSYELSAAARAFSAKCNRCPCKYVADSEANPACIDEESWDCCNAYIVYRETYYAYKEKLRDKAASA